MIVILVHLKIQLESMNVTSFLIISYLSNSEYWSQRRSQSVSIHSIYCICLVSTWWRESWTITSHIMTSWPSILLLSQDNNYPNLWPATRIRFRTPGQMKAQANTTREQSNNKNNYDIGWQPSHGENEGEGKKNSFVSYHLFHSTSKLWTVQLTLNI